MADSFEMSLHFDRGFVPTQIQAGQVTDAAFRSLNMWYRKDGRNENWQGIFDITEHIPRNYGSGGTVSITANHIMIQGTGTLFETDVIRGMHIVVNGPDGHILYLIREVIDDTHVIVDPAPLFSGTGLSWEIAPRIMPVDNERAVLYGGTIIPYRTGTLAAVGWGKLYINGQDQGITLTKRLQLGVLSYPGGVATRTWFPGGLPDAPGAPALTLSASADDLVPDGRGMIQGNNSMVIARGRSSTKHFGNACDAVVQANAGNQKICITGLPDWDYANGQDLWRVYVSYQGLTELVTDDLARNGPWVFIDDLEFDATAPPPYVKGGLPKCYSWRNDQLPGDTPAYFDHDTPPDALYLTTMGDLLILYSCHGPDKTDPLSSTAPGPAIRTSLPGDPESYPPRALEYVNPLERINGALGAQGRSFAFTDNRVQLITATAADEKPIVSRPLWDTGTKHQGQAVVVNDRLYAFCGGGGSPTNAAIGIGGRPTRSNPYATGEAAQDFTFSAAVQDVTSSWVASRVFVTHDPKNQAVLFIHNNDHKNADGFWSCTAIAFMLETETWSGIFDMETPGSDFLVTGAADCAGQSYLVGWDGNPTVWKTYLWDAGNAPVICFVTSSFEDAGSPGIFKTVRGVQVIGRLAGPTTDDPQPNMVTLYRNNDPTVEQESFASGPVGIHHLQGDLSQVSVTPWWKTNLRLAKTFAVRVTSTWPGGAAKLVSFDEVVIKGTLRDVKHGSPSK